MPGWPRCSWAQSGVTSTSLRLMAGSSGMVGGGRFSGGAGGQDPPGGQAELAAQAEAGGGVEQGGDQRQAGGHRAGHRGTEQVPGGPDDGEEQADELGEA